MTQDNENNNPNFIDEGLDDISNYNVEDKFLQSLINQLSDICDTCSDANASERIGKVLGSIYLRRAKLAENKA